MRKESFPVKTRLAAGFMVLGAGAAALTGCSNHTSAAPKPSHHATTSVEASPTPTHSNSSVESTTTPPSPKPTEFTTPPSSKLTAAEGEKINFCKFPNIMKLVGKLSFESNLFCDYEPAGSAGVAFGDTTYYYAKGTNLNTPGGAPYVAAIRVRQNNPVSDGEFTGAQPPDYVSMVDGMTCNWNTQSVVNSPSGLGLACLLGNKEDTTAAVAQASINNMEGQASYQEHEQLAVAVLEATNSDYNIGLTSENKAPACISLQECH